MATSATSNFRKNDDLWFSPEVIILRAQNHVFRIFVSILRAKSSVFADMFSFPSPPTSEVETIDGIQVVDLHDDPEELGAFLKAIFDADFFLPPPTKTTTKLQDIIGILRMAHKYDVAFLRRRALEHLDLLYPIHLPGFEAFEGWDSVDHLLYSSEKDRHLIVIKAAVEVGATWLLPAAYYYLCASTDIREIMTDGSSWNDIGDPQKMACITGYTALLQYSPKMWQSLMTPSDEDICRDTAECDARRLELASALVSLGSIRHALGMLDPAWWASARQMFCLLCYSDTEHQYSLTKQEFWEELPSLFGLPAWSDLEIARISALNEATNHSAT
ncbi:hypothetical protein GGX14DRAFT_573877 [Mycena pura]|uniref:BTB domain-containing protein n=1 Tax=Mycena pura TaxID=153505 RepID=A0AAD6UYU1_9AGAR|nr:hypothetical protein GGX14DRAFT_573877 [Mycena pura]